GVPRTVTIDDSEIRESLSECVATILNAVRVALERTPPELSADISDRGIVLTGGGALLKNLDKRIREETGLPVSIADDPLASVVITQVLLLAVQIRREHQVRLIRVWAVAMITPIQRGGAWAIDGVRTGWSNYISLRQAHRENQELSAELERLKMANNQLESRAAEADRLAILLGFHQAHPDVPMVAARVIGASADTVSRTIYINRGEKQGLRRNMAVITPEGV